MLKKFFRSQNWFRIARFIVNYVFIVILLFMAIPGFERFLTVFQEDAVNKSESIRFLLIVALLFATVTALMLSGFYEQIRKQFISSIMLIMFVQCISILGIIGYEFIFVWVYLIWAGCYYGLRIGERYVWKAYCTS